MTGRTVRTSGLVLLVILIMAAAAAAGFLITRNIRADATPASRMVTPSAVASADAPEPTPSVTRAPAVDRAAVQAALAAPLRASGLGSSVLASVVDAQTGTVLLDRGAATPAAPASVTKIATAVAVLSVRPVTARITTTAVSDGRGTLALIGGGDPTLSAAPAGQATRYPEAGRLSDLVTQVRRANVRVGRIVVAGRFSGPAISPYWDAGDVPTSYGAGITALMTDGGRAAPADEIRSAQPDLDAGRSFAALLGSSAPVTRGSVTSGAVARGRTVGTVSSAPIGTLVEQMLLQSDNVIADCLSRQVALATGGPASFSGGAAATRAVLRGRVGVDVGGGLVDGSGLAARDRLAPVTLTSLLRAAARSSSPSVRTVTASLPVAGWSGSLAARYLSGSSKAGAGTVRAKTGTLTGVSTLAGLTHTRRGGQVAFAVFAERNDSTPDAQAALDAVVARLATCAC